MFIGKSSKVEIMKKNFGQNKLPEKVFIIHITHLGYKSSASNLINYVINKL